MRMVAMFRHGKKNKEEKTHLITKECLREIETQGISGINELLPKAKRIVIHLGTGWHRTRQTIKAFERYLTANGYRVAFYIRKYNRLGSKAIFNHLLADASLMEDANTKGWNYAVTHANGKYYDRLRENMKFALGDIFLKLRDGDLCISIGHNGLIEPLAHLVDPQAVNDQINLKELDGVIFQANRTSIKVKVVIK